MFTYENYISEMVEKYSVFFEESECDEVGQLFEIIKDENDLTAEQIEGILSLIRANLYDKGVIDKYGVKEE